MAETLETKDIDKMKRVKCSHEMGLDHIAPIWLNDDAIDPFVFLSRCRGCFPTGGRAHPHKNVEGITYILKGTMNHEDSMGDLNVLSEGSLLYIDAGKGFCHIEIPACEEEITDWVSVFVYLPPNQRTENRVMVFTPNNAIYQDNGVKLKVLAGEYQDVHASFKTKSCLSIYEITLDENATFNCEICPHNTVLALVIEGRITLGSGKIIKKDDFVEFKHDDKTKIIMTAANEEAKLLLFAAKPCESKITKKEMLVADSVDEMEELSLKLRSSSGFFSKSWKPQLGQWLFTKDLEKLLPH
jgi:redox-sensitive bicupin YhaK (pirin superfamily)